MNLDGLTMYVSSTAAIGVVGAGTLLHFVQKGDRVLARYSGGSIKRGYLVGEVADDTLRFAALDERRKTEASLHVAQGIEDRGFDGGTRQVHVSHRFFFVC